MVMSVPPRRGTQRDHRKSRATFLEEDVAPFDLRPPALAASYLWKEEIRVPSVVGARKKKPAPIESVKGSNSPSDTDAGTVCLSVRGKLRVRPI